MLAHDYFDLILEKGSRVVFATKEKDPRVRSRHHRGRNALAKGVVAHNELSPTGMVRIIPDGSKRAIAVERHKVARL